MNPGWQRVNRQFKCPACGRPDWCLYWPDRNLVLCMRLASGRPAKNGGWYHQYDSGAAPPPARPTQTSLAAFNMADYCEWKGRNNAPVHAQKYLNSLGCDPTAWYRLGAVWADTYRAWAIPMRDGREMIIGIQLRYLDGSKRAVKGSKNGLFIPDQPASGFALICEGASDTAAALTFGYFAIGRQSCAGGGDMLASALRQLAVKQIAFVTDNDEPGVNGAQRVSEALRLSYCFVMPPAKDLREFISNGGTRPAMDCLLRAAIWRKNV